MIRIASVYPPATPAYSRPAPSPAAPLAPAMAPMAVSTAAPLDPPPGRAEAVFGLVVARASPPSKPAQVMPHFAHPLPDLPAVGAATLEPTVPANPRKSDDTAPSALP